MEPYIYKIQPNELPQKVNDFLQRLYNNETFIALKELCNKNNVRMDVYIIKSKDVAISSLSIDFFDMHNNQLNEPDEPSGAIFIYETICFIKNNKYYFIDLLKEQCFIGQLSKIFNDIGKIYFTQ